MAGEVENLVSAAKRMLERAASVGRGKLIGRGWAVPWATENFILCDEVPVKWKYDENLQPRRVEV